MAQGETAMDFVSYLCLLIYCGEATARQKKLMVMEASKCSLQLFNLPTNKRAAHLYTVCWVSQKQYIIYKKILRCCNSDFNTVHQIFNHAQKHVESILWNDLTKSSSSSNGDFPLLNSASTRCSYDLLMLNVNCSSTVNQCYFKHTVVLSSNTIFWVCFDCLMRNTFSIQYQPSSESRTGNLVCC